MRFKLVLAALAAAVADPALAEPELHIVGIYEGSEETDGRIHGPEARVTVDRPGAEVTLVLADYGPVRWLVSATDGTEIARVILAGHRPERSEVMLDGARFDGVELRPDIDYSYRDEGRPFREMIEVLPAATGFERPFSFHGSYRAAEVFVIDAADPSLGVFDPDYLDAFVDADALTPALAEALSTPREQLVRFTGEGFEVREDDGTWKAFPVTLDVPDISWPVAGVADTSRGVLLGVTLGGDGYIYRLDLGSGEWSVLRGMDGVDAQGMFYDEAGDRLIVLTGASGGGRVDVLVLDPETGREIHRVSIDGEDFAGRNDLYDIGNGRPPSVMPLAIDREALLVTTGTAWPLEGDASRAYVLDIGSGEVALVGWSN
ncbi:hypothetical protein HKCCE2091_01760 [Rhodobacterales bacterium HKCCE2091]|nr:hypothetical protein [Rhodobacterales bacterium HKCCE2091]